MLDTMEFSNAYNLMLDTESAGSLAECQLVSWQTAHILGTERQRTPIIYVESVHSLIHACTCEYFCTMSVSMQARRIYCLLLFMHNILFHGIHRSSSL